MKSYWGLQGRGQNCFEYQLQHAPLIHKPHAQGPVCPMAESWPNHGHGLVVRFKRQNSFHPRNVTWYASNGMELELYVMVSVTLATITSG